MKKLLAITALALGIGAMSSQPAFADRYWDGHGWRERGHSVLVVKERYHGPRYYHGPYNPYYTYVEPAPVYVAPAPVYVAPAPVIYQPAPVASFNFRF